jgi:hypothetical protein
VRIIQHRIEDSRARRAVVDGVDGVDDDDEELAYSNGPRKRMRAGGDNGMLSYFKGMLRG